ncbi:diaminobutyrate--2-oxoglutarate transaminase family protein [Burkholderia gladioli]|uniref:diaminobutyrate--2-oxoglutarate transaminase family protein n=1 Tax=Burkholderia gladioli TaxID=28095 RepID=UPI001641EBA3|nr:diaminobutyrate--2-oxoglutarate transaminase family protein [Burkholderia gladioli]
MDTLDYLQRVESNARTYANTFRKMFVRAQGSRIYDADGKAYLDCLANAGTLGLGHNHPEVKEAVLQYLDSQQLQQALDLATPAKLAFVETLISQLPVGMRESSKIQFCGPSGSDAVEAAIKLARHHTGRSSIMAFHGAYHGMTAGSLAAMGNLNAKRAPGMATSGVHFLPYPYRFRCPFGTDGTSTDTLSINYIDNVLSDPESGIAKPAAIIVEAVQGEGGCIPASVEWLRALRELTIKHDVPLIVDEVQTGLGRTGKMFAIDHAGIIPDAIVLSKMLGGGYPLAVVVYNKVLDTWKSGMHAGTFRGNQIGMVAGAAAIRIIERDNIPYRAEKLGARFVEGLRGVAGRHAAIGDVRGRGLMIGVEITRPGSEGRAGAPDGALARAIKLKCFENGLIVETGGRDGSVLRFLPPLVMTEDEIGEALELFERSLASVEHAAR